MSYVPKWAKRGEMGSRQDLMGALDERESPEVIIVAQRVQHDFGGLVAIFDRQLECTPFYGEARSTIGDAKAAAGRGLQLSRRLIDLLENSACCGISS